jgi:hypothetical protein
MKRACVLLLLAVGVPSPAPAQPAVTFSAALADRLPSAEESAVEVLLGEAGRAAAGGGALAAEAPSASFLAGPRREEGGAESADFAIAVELPLLARRDLRAALGRSLLSHGAAVRSGAAAAAMSDLAAAFVAAWLAQASAELRARDLVIAEEWLVAARRRVEAGADPPYEPTLVAGERDRALAELLAARREVELAWGELAARAAVGSVPRPLSLDGLPSAPERGLVAEGPATVAVAARREIALALARLRAAAAGSRWAVASEVAAEGDERLAHLGLAYRLPLRGERAAAERELAAAESAAALEATRAEAALRARLAAAHAVLAAGATTVGQAESERALEALAARVAEGKERASQVLPLRRQLIEARLASLAAEAARARAAAEVHFLLGGSDDAP